MKTEIKETAISFTLELIKDGIVVAERANDFAELIEHCTKAAYERGKRDAGLSALEIERIINKTEMNTTSPSNFIPSVDGIWRVCAYEILYKATLAAAEPTEKGETP